MPWRDGATLPAALSILTTSFHDPTDRHTALGVWAGATVLLAWFVGNERRHRNPMLPPSIFRIKGLAAADVTGLISFAGLIAMFFFLTLYMQNVLGYSPIQTGAAYLPLCFGVGIAAGITSQLISRVGTRPLIVTGALIASRGLYWLSRC